MSVSSVAPNHAFWHSFSEIFVENFSKKLPSLETEDIDIYVVGMSKFGSRTQETRKASDYVLSLKFDRFKELIKDIDKQLSEEFESFASKAWKECTGNFGCSLIEIFIHTSFREKNLFLDTVIVENKENALEKLLYIRKSAELNTQCPTSFRPLYTGSFGDLQEVCQGQYAITHAKDKKPVLASWHFACCVGLIGFNVERQIGFLAHIDTVATYTSLIDDLKKIFSSSTTTMTTVEYILIGGGQDNLKDAIQKTITAANSNNLTFKFVASDNTVEIKEDHFYIDSSWTSSVRLNRSVALDTRKGSFTNCLTSYEPYLNPESSRYKRSGTVEETVQFEKARKSNNALTKVYDSVSKATLDEKPAI